MSEAAASEALAGRRQRYAEMVTATVAGADPRLREAFATVARERFAGPPPWTLLGVGDRAMTTSDPSALYADVLISLDAAKGINNGSPSLHALMLHRLGVRPGDRVLHVGVGGGYYTAILAELAGPHGRVTAVEFDPALARRAAGNLRDWPWARVIAGDGAAFPNETVERVYVNFALADPADAWLDHLAVGGRLVLPLGVPHPRSLGADRRHSARGALLVVARTPEGYAAGFDTRVAFVFAEGVTAGDAATRDALFAAFERGGMDAVKSLRRGPGPAGRTWFSAPRWSLATVPPAGDKS
jgi:protein-L-isoaspartate(D-aspartate) O-methyltransferase